MSLGNEILDEITKQGMVTLQYPPTDETVVFAWSVNFEDQVEAVIVNHLQKCEHNAGGVMMLGTRFVWCSKCGSIMRLTSDGTKIGSWQSPDIV